MRPKVSRISRAAAFGIGLAGGTFRVDVDEAHLNVGERLGKLTIPAVALVAKPGIFRTPENLLGLPGVRAAEPETKGLEAHRLDSDVAGQDEQVGPGDFLAILLLDGPQQPAGFVEIGVVGPAIQRCETLLAGTATSAAVGDPVRAGGVPGHADEKRAVVAVVGGPPRL